MNRTLTTAGMFVRTSLAALATISALVASSPAVAVDFDTNVNGGNWGNAATWTPGGGPPTSGNSVLIDLGVVVSDPRSFGNNTTNSTWTGGGQSIVINPGQTLTHVAGSTLLSSPASGQNYFSSTGTFINQGTVLNSARFLLGYPAPGSQMNNTGTFEFVSNGANLELYSNGVAFNNQAGGTVRVNLGAAAQVARIDGSVDTTGQYLHAGGNPIDFVQGRLIFAPPGGVGGTLNDAAFASLFGTINANSHLTLSGGLSNIALSNASDLTRVSLGDSGTPFRAASGGTTINVTNTAGLKFSPSVAHIELPAGRSMTNVTGSKLVSPAAAGYTALGNSGTFYNQGEMEIENRFILSYPSPGTTLENSGLFEFTLNGGRLEYLLANGTFRNVAGGTVRVNLPNATDQARIYWGSADNNGQYLHAGGNPIDFVQGRLDFAPSGGIGGTLDDTMFANLFGPINANSRLQLGGNYNIDLTGATDLTRATLGGSGADAAYRPATVGGLTIKATGPGGMKFTNFGFVEAALGRTITNLPGSTLLAPATNQENYIGGTGTFDNQGTLQLESTRFIVGYSTPGTTLSNNGLINMVQNQSRVELLTLGTLRNEAAGEIDVTLPTNTDVARVYIGGGTGSFENIGTVEVNRGTFRVESNVNTTSWSNTTLNTGTYRLLGHSTTATLDLLSSATSVGTAAPFDGSIVSIGAGATLVMSQTGAGATSFPQLGLINSVAGELMVHSSQNLPVANAVAVSGTLGGSGSFSPLSAGTISFTGGQLDPSSLTGGAGTLTINGGLVLDGTTQLTFSLDTPGIVGSGVNDLVVVNGDLTLDGVLEITDLAGFGSGIYRLFNYTGSLTNSGLDLDLPEGYQGLLDLSTFGQVNLAVFPIPEPSTGLLLFVGLTGLAGVRRRKRQAARQ